ncbi:hypothetical protein B0A49_01303 [Cryomyces minteri]|uniref:Uncharacterized protein n=1 Tax=Cryomyces minteri TaxID=331657 RepID=A0A4U0XMU4_9PEZI|nr:hypothetical protein B0A49_01303 [Cryomyces minteri]
MSLGLDVEFSEAQDLAKSWKDATMEAALIGGGAEISHKEGELGTAPPQGELEVALEIFHSAETAAKAGSAAVEADTGTHLLRLKLEKAPKVIQNKKPRKQPVGASLTAVKRPSPGDLSNSSTKRLKLNITPGLKGMPSGAKVLQPALVVDEWQDAETLAIPDHLKAPYNGSYVIPAYCMWPGGRQQKGRLKLRPPQLRWIPDSSREELIPITPRTKISWNAAPGQECLKIENRAADVLGGRTHNLAAAIDTQMKFLVAQPSSPMMLRRALRTVNRILAVKKMAIASDDPTPLAAESPENGSEPSAGTSITKNAAAVLPPPRDKKADAAGIAENKSGSGAPPAKAEHTCAAPAKDEKPSSFLRLL